MDSQALQQLPGIGATYYSLHDFKLAVYKACVDQKVRVDAVRPSVNKLPLYCTLRPRTRQAKENCPFGARAEWRGSSTTGVFVVVESSSHHSCRMEQNETVRGASEAYMKAELEKLETSLGGSAVSKQPALVGVDGGSSLPAEKEGMRLRKPSERAMVIEHEAEDDDVSASSDDEPEDRGAAEQPRMFYSVASTHTSSSIDSPSPKSGPKLVHPHVHTLESKIRRLANSGPLTFPSPTRSFATHTDIRIHCCAVAYQQGATLVLRNKGVSGRAVEAGTAFSLRCTKSRKRKSSTSSSPACPAYVAFGLNEENRWMMTSSKDMHNHTLLPPRLDWQEEPTERSSKIARVEKASAEAPQSPEPPFASTSAFQQPMEHSYNIPQQYTPPHRTASSNYAPQPSHLSASVPQSAPSSFSTPSLSPSLSFSFNPPIFQRSKFLPQLSFFLQSLTTSPSILSLAPTLLGAGLNSENELVLLLSLSEESLDRCVEDLCEKGRVARLQMLVLKKLLRGARERALGGGEGVEV